MIYTVKTGKKEIKVEADNMLDAAAMRCLLDIGQLIEVTEHVAGSEPHYTCAYKALIRAAELSMPPTLPAKRRKSR